MIKFELKGIKEAQKALRTFAKQALPHAARNALNRSAFEAQKEWRGEVKRTMTTRNTFTERSIQVGKARGINMRSMTATVGSTAPYMATREEGETKKGGKRGVPIPTVSGARGGSLKRAVPRGKRLGNIRLTARARTGNRKQRNAIAIRRAVKTGNRFVFLELESKVGLFRIMGGKRKLSVKMLWDMSKGSVRVAPMPTLERTLQRLEPKLTRFHLDALREQCKRHGIFGY